MPQITSLTADSLSALQSFLVSLDPIPSRYLGDPLYLALGALLAGSAAVAGVLAYQLFERLVSDAQRNHNPGLEAFAWLVMAMAILGAILDVAGFAVHSVPATLIGIALDLLSAGIVVTLLASTSGSPVSVPLGAYIAAALLCGMGSAALDIVSLDAVKGTGAAPMEITQYA
ncbi:MAG TPA: hypothetical protein VMH49_02030 [Thermoplasmata archaeon]|nr:hypothetical protein [Thermoplasmata archaeon]